MSVSPAVVFTGGDGGDGGGDGANGGDGGGDGLRSSDAVVVVELLLSTIVRLMVTLAPSTFVVCGPPPEV